ncbi:MAG: transglutaminase domain-containing protein [Candidatus Lokiarchaeota archaeon]|nr:transglutaminase domain-containing protein [Candidatus Lokiarchaeota archaeon]
MEKYLSPTYFIDSDSDLVSQTANNVIQDAIDQKEKAIKLFYWTRDKIKYDAYSLSSSRRRYRASKIIQEGKGWCVQKAVLLTALARSINLPARLHFADIRNHQTPDKLKEIMGTDIFLYHGYTELYLHDKWVKVTPTFNKELCDKFGYKKVEFDGIHDAILPSTTLNGEKYIEYLNDRGTNQELPLKEINRTFSEYYPFKK